jgi:type 1 glutamine amidotransferase
VSAVRVAIGVALLSAITIVPYWPTSAGQEAGLSDQVLVFTRTTGFRHDSIPDGVAAIRQLGSTHRFGVRHTEDPSVFTDGELAGFRAVVFLLTTGHVLDGFQQAAFERYIRNGGGFVGVHSATDTEYEWPWYGELVGAYFASHPAIQSAVLHVEDPTAGALPEPWMRTDEWYNFRANPRERGVRILLTLDEASYSGGAMGDDHPIAWSHEYDGGRAWYTAGGHTSESYSEPAFVEHLWSGIQYAAALASVSVV